MQYLVNTIWNDYYEEMDPEKRWEIYQDTEKNYPDDGANALRKKLYKWRYTNPKKPGKRVDNGIWEMIVMPAHLSGFIAFRSKIRKHISDSLQTLQINEETLHNEVLLSAVYWEIRNIAKLFYETCKSPKYARKLFGIQESSWEEKQVRISHDVWIMAEQVPERFGMIEEMKTFTDAVVDEFYCLSTTSEQIYKDVRVKMKRKRFPIIL